MRGKAMGWFFIILAGVTVFAALAFMGVGYAAGKVSAAGALLGIILFGLLPAAMLAGGGIYLLAQARKAEAEAEHTRKLERILGMIQAHGQVPIDQIMLEMHMTREQVQNAIYELVSLGLFTGYIDWEKMTFYTADAAQVVSTTCPNCGGQREFVGKGIVRCPYCGATIFIPPRAAEPATSTSKPATPTTPTSPEAKGGGDAHRRGL
ncbi:MAG: hypothetical protein GXO54_00800 [Chloroflexi bacterium]|nr:hypothetical protein [Chloroflexota bacterium]